MKLYFKNESEVKTLSDIQKLKEFISSRSAIQEIYKIFFIYLTGTAREGTEARAEGEGKAGSPLSWEPDGVSIPGP